MSTKIPAHRIGDKIIGNEHLSDDFKIEEGSRYLQLTNPTHSNANDLTVTQKAILTQHGNADTLHYHSGGGGGEEGIYTHRQIDVALLKLMMQINALKYRLENSVLDEFDDDTGIDYGVTAPTINEIIELTSSTGTTTLDTQSSYFYRLAAKYKDGSTYPSLPVRINTSSDNTVYHSVRLNVTVNPDNKGIKLWRAKTADIVKDVPFDIFNNLYSPTGLNARMIPPDQNFNHKQALLIEFVGPNSKDPSDIDVLAASNGGQNVGEPLGIAILNKTEVVYCVTTPLTQEVSVLKIIWSTNPAYIPLGYKIHYSNILNPDVSNDAHWQPILDLKKVIIDPAIQTYTDGDILTNSTIQGNTKVNNQFVFQKRRVTGIRVTVDNMLSGASLTSIAALYTGNSNGEYVVQSTPDNNYNLSEYKSLLVDVQADDNPSRFSIGLMTGEQFNNSVSDQVTIFSLSNNNTNISGTPNRVFRTVSYIGNRTDANLNRIKFRFVKPANQRVRITSVSVGLGTAGNASVRPDTQVRVTFKGLDFYDETDANAYIESDWVGMNFSDNYAYVLVSFVLEVGTLYGYGSNGNMYTYYRDDGVGYGFSEPSTSGWVSYQANYTYVHYVYAGAAFNSAKLEQLPGKGTEPHTHVVDISGIAPGITNLKGLAYSVDSASISGKIKFSNLRFGNVKELCGSSVTLPPANVTVTSTASGSSAQNCRNGEVISYWESGVIPTTMTGENIMFKFNDYYPISRIRLCENSGDPAHGLESYSIQYAIEDNALVDDPLSDLKWAYVPNLRIEKADVLGFTGEIIGGKVTHNNLRRVYIDHTFDEVVVKAVRIVFHKTAGDTAVRLYGVKIYTADTPEEWTVIKDTNIPLPAGESIIDDGITGTLAPLNKFNTTGSYNIKFDNVNGHIEVMDKTQKGVFVSNRVDVGSFMRYLVVLQESNNNNSKYFISNDDGNTWHPVTVEDPTLLDNMGNQFRFKAELNGDDILSAYSVLYSL